MILFICQRLVQSLVLSPGAAYKEGNWRTVPAGHMGQVLPQRGKLTGSGLVAFCARPGSTRCVCAASGTRCGATLVDSGSAVWATRA